MKKVKLVSILLASVLLLASCGSKAKDAVDIEGVEPPSEVEVLEDVTTAPDVSEVENSETEAAPQTVAERIKELTGTLTVNQYPELEVTAAILERNIILPGMPFKVHVNLKNNGDKTIGYVHGSGSVTNPSSVYLLSEGVQAVLPEDYLGAMTMDFQVKVLAPGESAEFVYNMLAINPTPDFDLLSMDYQQTTGAYIGEQNIEKINATYPELTAVEEGKYTGEVYFFYTVVEDAENLSTVSEPTGYTLVPFDISIGG